MSKGVDMGRSENGGQRCDVGDLQGHRHRRHDEPKCGVCEMSQMILLSSFDSSESLSFLQSEYSLFRSQLICVHFHSAGIRVCVCVHVCVCQLLSHVRLFVTPWTGAHQAPLSVGFSRQEHWSGSPFSAPITRKKDTMPISSHHPAPTWVRGEVLGRRWTRGKELMQILQIIIKGRK